MGTDCVFWVDHGDRQVPLRGRCGPRGFGGVTNVRMLLAVTDEVRPSDPMASPWPQTCSGITTVYDATNNADFRTRVESHRVRLRQDFPLGSTVPSLGDGPATTREKKAFGVMENAAMALQLQLITPDPVAADVQVTATLMLEQSVACPSAVTSG